MDEDDDDGDDDDFCTKEDLVGCDDDNSDNDVWAEPVDMICEFSFCGCEVVQSIDSFVSLCLPQNSCCLAVFTMSLTDCLSID